MSDNLHIQDDANPKLSLCGRWSRMVTLLGDTDFDTEGRSVCPGCSRRALALRVRERILTPREPPFPHGATLPPMSPSEINALPERVRRYIHDLETRADPAGDVRALWAAREAAESLAERVRELEQPPRVTGERAPVRQRHRAATVRVMMPATTESSWVWAEYVTKGDASSPQLRDVMRVAQLVADAEAGLLLPAEMRAAPAAVETAGLGGMTTTAFMGERDEG